MRFDWITWDNALLTEKGILEIGDGYRAKNSEMGLVGLPFARAGNIDNGFHFENADILDEESVKKAGDKTSKPQYCELKAKKGERRDKKVPHLASCQKRKKKELSDVQITANGCR